jgi:probable HAF family extracellular repeat protein
MNWGGINDLGQAVGISETSDPDPNGEDVCRFGTGKTCRPFLWQFGHMSALPTLGGNNGQASDINDHGQIAGTAETTITDPGCPPFHISLPVLWEEGKPHALPTVDKDPDGLAVAINGRGQAVGQTNNCSQSILHAVSWENDVASQLPDYGNGATAYGVNDQGQIVGTVVSSDNTTEYAAIWKNGVLTNLYTLPEDFAAIATGINDQGQVVGSTLDSGFNWSHAFIVQNGVVTDLNTLFPSSSNLFATMANKINQLGEISGMGTVRSGPHKCDTHAFLAIPVNASIGESVADVESTHPKSNLPANVRDQLLQRFGLARFER